MAERTTYTPGSFCWTDLTTTDQPAAKAFYSALFGWDSTDNPVGEGIVYSMMSIDGRDVAAISPQPEQQRAAGVPPAWNSYVAVEDADAALARATELGATVHAPAFDVLEVGRMGVVQDPQGAYFLVWQPKLHAGAGLVNAPGALTWNELASTDHEAAGRFYSELLGWRVEPMPGPTPYLMCSNSAGWPAGGIRPVMPPGTPPHWLAYFGTDDLDASLARAGEHGASTVMGPIEIDRGRIAAVLDPQGAAFALYQGVFDD
jgi:uncharacterized protein